MPFLALNEIEQSHGTLQLISDTNTLQHEKGSTIVLVPQPNRNDPNDPLNWPFSKRVAAFWSVLLLSALCNWAITGISPGLGQIIGEFECTLTQATWLIAICPLGEFFGCYTIAPFALKYGKRPLWILCSVVFLVCNIWGAVAKSFVSLLLARFFASWAAGTSEPLSVGTASDIFFLHERGTQTGIQALWLSVGASIAPALCGFLIQDAGWRWFQWLTAILSGINVVLIFLLVPETQYARDLHEALDSAGVGMNHNDVANEKGAETMQETLSVSAGTALAGSTTRDIPTIPKKSYLSQLKPWSPVQQDVNLLGSFIRPWATWCWPSMAWAVFSFSIHICSFTILVTIFGVYLAAPPYNFTPSEQGLVFFSPVIGNFFGSFLCGYLNDKYSQWASRRNGGVFEPEMRLPLIIFPAILVPTGLLMFACGLQNGLHWIIPTIGSALVCIAVTGIGSVAQPYMMDSYAPVMFDCVVNFNGFKNIISFGVTFGIIPWIALNGTVGVFGILSGLVLVIDAAVLVIYIWGKKFRQRDTRLKIFLF